MTEQQLLETGFSPGESPEDNYDACWWITVKDEKGKLFFVQVRFWNFSKYSTPDYPAEDGWDAEAHMILDGGCFRVGRSIHQLTPIQAIDWFKGMWYKLECDYTELWESKDEQPVNQPDIATPHESAGGSGSQ